MCYIPDPIELLEMAEERQFDLIDENGKYPCFFCGRKFFLDEMHPISAHPASPLKCGLPDCKENEKNE